jgi:hypothetical protein
MFGLPHQALLKESSAKQGITTDSLDSTSSWIGSKEYVETRNVIFHLAGNGPIFVNKKTGKVDFYGSTPPLVDIIDSYEKSS